MQIQILIGLFICHFLADYTHLSTAWMLNAKRLGKPLYPIFTHAFIHNKKQKVETTTEPAIVGNNVLPAVSWYKSLTINQKMALKEVSELICGMKWEDFNILFSPRERLEILHNKLMLEGFDV